MLKDVKLVHPDLFMILVKNSVCNVHKDMFMIWIYSYVLLEARLADQQQQQIQQQIMDAHLHNFGMVLDVWHVTYQIIGIMTQIDAKYAPRVAIMIQFKKDVYNAHKDTRLILANIYVLLVQVAQLEDLLPLQVDHQPLPEVQLLQLEAQPQPQPRHQPQQGAHHAHQLHHIGMGRNAWPAIFHNIGIMQLINVNHAQVDKIMMLIKNNV